MSEKLKIIKNFFTKHYSLAVFIIFGLTIYITGYWHIKSIGIYGDDWGASTYLFNNNIFDAVRDWWKYGSGEISNFRMLASVIPILWFYVFKFFGLAGVVFLNFFTYTILAYLFYLLLKSAMSGKAATFGAMLFALYPTNNAYLWQVTMSYVLALICVFAAAYFFQKPRWFYSAVLLAVSILINEGVFFIYFIALLPKEGEYYSLRTFWPLLKKWLVIALGILAVYGTARIFFELSGATGGNRAVSVLHNFNFVSYMAQFIKSFAVVLIISFAAVFWKIYYYFQTWHLAAGFFGFLALYSLFKFSKSGVQNVFKHQAWLIMLMGLMLIVAGRYYGFYFVPSINVLNLDTRYYFAASVGGAVFFAGLFEYLLLKFSTRKTSVIIFFACAIISVLAMFKYEVQLDYSSSFAESRIFWKQLLFNTPVLPENSLVVVNIPDKILGRPVNLFEAAGDLRVVAPRVYNKKVVFVTSPFLQSLEIGPNSVCINSAPFYKHECFEKSKTFIFDWKNEQLTQVTGASTKTIKEGAAQKIHNNFKKAILQ